MRSISRWCVCAALLIPSFHLAAQGVTEQPGSGSLQPHARLALDIYRELIEIDTTHSTGSTTAAAQAMAARLVAAGFEAADVQILEELPRKGNLIARYPGRNEGARPLLLLAHLDVVEADPADWSVHPFKFLEHEGYYYGRGTLDDKDEAAIYVANFLRMRAEGFVPDRDIILALTADEEGGADNGVEWLVANHRELIDAELALNEGGGGAIRNGRRISNNVQTTEKVYQSFALEIANPGGHSSLPVKDNAIYRLADALIKIRNHDFPVELNETTRAFFKASAELQDAQLGAAMRGVLQTPPDPQSVELLATIPAYNSQLRTTCVATLLDAGHAENALPQRAQATVNCRILPGQAPADVQQTLGALIADSQVTISPLDIARPSDPSPLAENVMGAIDRITEEMWPGVAVVPTMSTGATDSLYLRNVGIPAYGVSGVFADIDDNRAHGRDERILVTAFFEGQEFLYRLVKALSLTSLPLSALPE